MIAFFRGQASIYVNILLQINRSENILIDNFKVFTGILALHKSFLMHHIFNASPSYI